MIKINDYATKNNLNEWEIKDLPEGDVYRLDLQDLGIIFALPISSSLSRKNIYIPTYLSVETAKKLENIFYIFFGRANEPKVYLLNCDYKINYEENATGFCSIIPDWSKYIAKDSAVLFLNEADYLKNRNLVKDKYFAIQKEDGIDLYEINDECNVGCPCCRVHLREIKKVSIIIPSIHSQNIQEVSDIAKDLKENYGVEYVEVVAKDFFLATCFTSETYLICLSNHNTQSIGKQYNLHIIDKIIATDSTGILEPQKSERLEVIDCEEFFNQVNL